MVVSSRAVTKNETKAPAARLKRHVTVSPTHKSIEDEVIYLRSQNKLLKNALNAVENTASEKLCKSGVLAASRMFKDHADVSHVSNDPEEVFDSAHQAVKKHQEKIEESKEAFPNASADTFPVVRGDSN
eukprot:scaffold7923_cov154-Skeletonema_menzelii.AAC.11